MWRAAGCQKPSWSCSLCVHDPRTVASPPGPSVGPGVTRARPARTAPAVGPGDTKAKDTTPVKLSRSARLGGMALAGALALAACGSDNNTAGSSSSGAAGAGRRSPAVSGSLNGEASTAQKTAIDEATATFTQNNLNAKVSYNPTGS